MKDDDAFWRLELTNENDRIEGESLFDKLSNLEDFDNRQYRVFTRHTTNRGDVFLFTNKLDTEGVFDTVGGQLWEACILLCCYILKYPSNYLRSNILELGSGQGLPGLLAIFLKQKLISICSGKSEISKVIFSDCNLEILNNLSETVQSQPSWCALHHECSDTIITEQATMERNFIEVFIAKLDWADHSNLQLNNISAFKPCLQPEADVSFSEVSIKELQWIAMGSALVYTTEMTYLADTIRSLLLDFNMKEVVIIQIADRPGFVDFLHRLQLLDLYYSLDEIPTDVYDNAKRVQVRPYSHYLPPPSATAPAPSVDTTSSYFPPLKSLDRPIEIVFPEDMFSHIFDDYKTDTDTGTDMDTASHYWKSQVATVAAATTTSTTITTLPQISIIDKRRSPFQFLSTAREAFVILTIRLQPSL